MESPDARRLAAEAIEHPAKIRQIVAFLYNDDLEKRFAAVKALGEITRCAPELMRQRWERIFHSLLPAGRLQLHGISLGHVPHLPGGPAMVRWIRPGTAAVPFLRQHLHPRPALWALGELRVREAAGMMRGCLGDEGETWCYENEAVCRKPIKEIAGEALQKIEGAGTRE